MKKLYISLLLFVLFAPKIVQTNTHYPVEQTQANATNFFLDDFVWDTDKEAIIELLKNNWKDCCDDKSVYEDQWAEYMFKKRNSANYRQKKLFITVLKNNDQKIIGFITYTRFDSLNNTHGPDIYYVNAPLDTGHIEMLAVNESYRRCGCGTMLIQHAIDHLTQLNVENINIVVHNNNTAALRCYEKFGFTFDRAYDPTTSFLIKRIKNIID